MRIRFIALVAVACFLGIPGSAQTLDLKIKDVVLDPQPAGFNAAKIQLGTYRSYRMTVTLEKTIALPKTASFVVRTECIRNGKSINIGESRVGESKGWFIYATYDVYPGEAGAGDCLLRTTVDADNEIAETDESAVSNRWDRNATLLQP